MMPKSKTPPQPLMKRVVYPFVLGALVYLISSTLFFVLAFLFVARWTRGFVPFFFFFGYPISFLVLGPLLTLGFAYQRNRPQKIKNKQKNLSFRSKEMKAIDDSTFALKTE